MKIKGPPDTDSLLNGNTGACTDSQNKGLATDASREWDNAEGKRQNTIDKQLLRQICNAVSEQTYRSDYAADTRSKETQ